MSSVSTEVAGNLGGLHGFLFRRFKGRERSSVFAVLDGARDPAVYQLIKQLEPRQVCLYSGELSPKLAAAAPRLVELEPDAAFTWELLNLGWGRSWGIFLIVESGSTLELMRRHLRKHLRVRGPGGRILLFRFYDPRVLRVFLPTCTFDQLMELSGPIDRYVMEGAATEDVLEFRYDLKGLSRRDLLLSELPGPQRMTVKSSPDLHTTTS